VKQERQHSELIQGVESFKTERLKRTNTREKIVLPNAQGMLCAVCFIFFALTLKLFLKFLYEKSWIEFELCRSFLLFPVTECLGFRGGGL
jgi:hypothetical protein